MKIHPAVFLSYLTLVAVLCLAPSEKVAAEELKTLTSAHYKLYYESPFAPAGVLNDLEGLHVKLLMDLNDFVPWANQTQITVYLYKDKESYQTHTGIQPWAGGHVNMGSRTIFCFESENFRRVMAHELAHLFFDDFFVQKKARAPAWLTEGVATLMEWDYGLEESRPMDKAAGALEWEPLDSFLAYDYHTQTRDPAAISMWYLQAYSVVRFMIRQFSQVQFFLFCKALRDGSALDQSLAIAYGIQMWDVPSLERLWRKHWAEE